MRSKVLTNKRLFWISAGLLTLLLIQLLNHSPGITERWYGAAIYPLIHSILSHTIGILPFPAVGALLVLAVWLLYRTAIRPILNRKVTVLSFTAGFISTLGALVFLFYLLWGFNYFRPGIVTRMDLSLTPLDSTAIKQEYRRALSDVSTELKGFKTSKLRGEGLSDSEMRVSAQKTLRSTLESIGFPALKLVRGRVLWPKGILMRFNTAGIFIPYSGEGNIDGGLLSVQRPYTLMHEMAHGHGITNEGECNFVAYLACYNSDDPHIRFSGLLSYWRYTAGEYRRFFPREFEVEYNDLPPELLTILDDIHRNDEKYPDILPRFRNKVYDTYLRSNGISEGLKSYNTVVMMSEAYQRAGGELLQNSFEN